MINVKIKVIWKSMPRIRGGLGFGLVLGLGLNMLEPENQS